MKKTIIGVMIGIGLLILIFLSGCTTTPTKQEIAQKKVRELQEKYKTLDLQKNEIYVENVVVMENDNYEFKNFSIANATMTILGLLKLQNNMEVENQYRLAKAMFMNIPIKYKDKWIRDVLVGKYFPDGSDLIISVHVFPVNKSTGIKADSLIFLLTNISKFKISKKGSNKSEFTSTGYPINTNINKAGLFVIFNDNLLVSANNINKKDVKVKLKDDAIQKINLTDIYIKDPILENDNEVIPILENILSDSSLSNTEHTAARLNMYLYYLYQDKLDNAYKIIKDLNENIPSGLDESLIKVIKTEAPNLLRIIKTLDTGDESFLKYNSSKN